MQNEKTELPQIAKVAIKTATRGFLTMVRGAALLGGSVPIAIFVAVRDRPRTKKETTDDD